MMGSDLVARERIAQLMREAEAERLARPIAQARKAARRERVLARVHAVAAAVARRRRRGPQLVVER